MRTIQVLLVDDQQIARAGIGDDPGNTCWGIKVVGEASDGEEAIDLALELAPDVVLMDLKMPRLGGIPATRKIRATQPDTHVIILTTYDADDMVFEGDKGRSPGVSPQGCLERDTGGRRSGA